MRWLRASYVTHLGGLRHTIEESSSTAAWLRIRQMEFTQSVRH
jgi:hypothetical protein